MTTTAQFLPAPPLLSPVAHNWKLALLGGLVVSAIAIALFPAKFSLGVVGAMAALIAAAFTVNAYRRRYYGGLLVAPAIAVLFVMNIFPLLWSLGLSFFAYQSNNQSIRFVASITTSRSYQRHRGSRQLDALINTGMFVSSRWPCR